LGRRCNARVLWWVASHAPAKHVDAVVNNAVTLLLGDEV
jgi:hypothetical protein